MAAKSNTLVRLLTALAVVPAMLALMFVGPAWGWMLFVLVASGIGAFELFGMTHPGDRLVQAGGIALTALVYLSIWYGFARNEPRLWLTAALLVPMLSLLLNLWRMPDELSQAALRMAVGTFGPVWLGTGLGSVAALRLAGGERFGAGYVVFALVLSWLSDTGAYFAGRKFGRHKLAEKISPKKTVEGAIGGIASATVGAVIAQYLLLPNLPLRDAVILGVLGSLLGIFGDLGESVLKRSVGVKDSGGIVPGHGGILDRVDATMITAPMLLLYLVWLR
ncbi:MAG: phosphatidate cytidylyltransferase [Myxococcota bacterium]